jgi:glycosyltransferase involved in cell wall biosynthesis
VKEKMLNILVVTPRLKPLSNGVIMGGANVSALRLSMGLKRLGAEITFACGTTPDRARMLPDLMPWARVLPIPIAQRQGTLGYGLSFCQKFARQLLLGRLEYDLVSFHSGYAHYAAILPVLGRLARRPAVYTAYCPFGGFAGLYRAVRPLVRRSLNAIQKVVAISENVAKSLVSAGVDRERVTVIPPPVDTESFNPDRDGRNMRESLHLEDKEVVFLFVGNYKEEKGLDILIRAFGAVLRRLPNTRLVYSTGHRPHRADRRKERVQSLVREMRYADKITHLDAVSHMGELVAAANVIVVPFLFTDGPSDYPIAIIEAMAAGKPVIATDIGGVPEIVGDGETGVLVKAGDEEALANSMQFLAEDENSRKRFGENAVKQSARFGMGSVARETLAVYRNICDRL